MDEGQAAFRAGRAAMTIDGTFRLGAFGGDRGLRMGRDRAAGQCRRQALELRQLLGQRHHHRGRRARSSTAAKKFLAFITSPEAMEIWLKTVGELPARRAAALTEENLNDPIYGPFLKALEYAHTTLFVDETAQRQICHRHGEPRAPRRASRRPSSLAQAADGRAGDHRRTAKK